MKEKVVSFLVGVCLALVAGRFPAAYAEGGKVTTPEKAKAVEGASDKEKAVNQQAVLSIGQMAGNKVMLELANTVPVRGVQCTLQGARITEVRTTSRTPGFLAKFNEENGIIIIISTAAEEIAPGTGPVAEIICEKVPGKEISLSNIKLAGRERRPL